MFDMITTLIGIQTVAVITATSYVIKHFRPKFPKFKVSSNDNGYKIYKSYQEVTIMGTTFVVMTTLKLCAMGAVGIGLTTAFQFFHNFDFKPNKKKGGETDDISQSLREKSRSLS